MKLSIDQPELLEEVAEACENEPGVLVYAVISEFEGIEYVSDFAYKDLPSQKELMCDDEEYEEVTKEHWIALDSLFGKIKTMSIEQLYEILLEQNRII